MLYGFLQYFFRLIFYTLFRTRVYGRENIPAEGAVILAANHASNIDPPLMASLIERPVSYMAKIELFENPIFGAAIRRCHAFPVKRGESDRGAIKAAVTVLKEGRVLGLFPEGTRSKTGELQKAEFRAVSLWKTLISWTPTLSLSAPWRDGPELRLLRHQDSLVDLESLSQGG